MKVQKKSHFHNLSPPSHLSRTSKVLSYRAMSTVALCQVIKNWEIIINLSSYLVQSVFIGQLHYFKSSLPSLAFTGTLSAWCIEKTYDSLTTDKYDYHQRKKFCLHLIFIYPQFWKFYQGPSKAFSRMHRVYSHIILVCVYTAKVTGWNPKHSEGGEIRRSEVVPAYGPPQRHLDRSLEAV